MPFGLVLWQLKQPERQGRSQSILACVTNESNGMGNGYGRYETNAFVPDQENVSNLVNATMQHAGQPSLWWTCWHQAAQCAAEVVGAHFFDMGSPRARASYAWVA